MRKTAEAFKKVRQKKIVFYLFFSDELKKREKLKKKKNYIKTINLFSKEVK